MSIRRMPGQPQLNIPILIKIKKIVSGGLFFSPNESGVIIESSGAAARVKHVRSRSSAAFHASQQTWYILKIYAPALPICGSRYRLVSIPLIGHIVLHVSTISSSSILEQIRQKMIEEYQLE